MPGSGEAIDGAMQQAPQPERHSNEAVIEGVCQTAAHQTDVYQPFCSMLVRMKTGESIGASDAKTHLSALLERVIRGESFVISRWGKPVARLIPAEPEVQRLAVDTLVEAARKLRAQVRARPEELRAWTDEGRR